MELPEVMLSAWAETAVTTMIPARAMHFGRVIVESFIALEDRNRQGAAAHGLR
jgi:hypothetical protein